MHFFHNMSLRRKQTLIIMLTSSTVLLLACAAFTAYDVMTFRRELIERVSVLANVVGNNCSAAIDFNDPKNAEEILGALRAGGNIVSGCVYASDGHIFAIYQRDDTSPLLPQAPRKDSTEFTSDQLQLFHVIEQKKQAVGTIYLASDLKDLSRRLTRYLSIAGIVFLASLLAGLALTGRLQRFVSDPILELARVARSVAIDKDYTVRASRRSDDELGQLVDGFNEMLVQIQARDTALQAARDSLEMRVNERTRELEITHKQLVEASRRGGMAEIATNVLHNVGNVLNSVNVSTDLIVQTVKDCRVENLARIVLLMREHSLDLGDFLTNDARGKHVAEYLGQFSEHLTGCFGAIASESESMRRNVEHIKEIVAMQQNYATFGSIKEVVNVVDLVEDSLRMNERSLNHHGLEVVRDYAKIPPMSLEKHKILQILVNLIRNAKYACDETGRDDKRLTVRLALRGDRIEISISDNGVGIAPENLTRIFNHGFTTRKGGHGFGLHGSALAAKEMGGSLTVMSEGPGRGAMFTLEIPALDGLSEINGKPPG
jgi:two-component system NtrC family sensor kinase